MKQLTGSKLGKEYIKAVYCHPAYFTYTQNVLCSSSRRFPNPGTEPSSPSLQVDSLPSEPPGKPKDTGMGNLSLLQGNFLSQELNWCLLPCHGKETACNVGDPRSIPGLGRSPGEGNGNPLQYSCLENPMDRGAWRTTVHSIAKSWT